MSPFWSLIKYLPQRNSREERFILAHSCKDLNPLWQGRHDSGCSYGIWRMQKLPADFSVDQKAKTGQEVGSAINCKACLQGPTSSRDPLLPGSLHLLMVPQPLHTAPLPGAPSVQTQGLVGDISHSSVTLIYSCLCVTTG